MTTAASPAHPFPAPGSYHVELVEAPQRPLLARAHLSQIHSPSASQHPNLFVLSPILCFCGFYLPEFPLLSFQWGWEGASPITRPVHSVPAAGPCVIQDVGRQPSSLPGSTDISSTQRGHWHQQELCSLRAGPPTRLRTAHGGGPSPAWDGRTGQYPDSLSRKAQPHPLPASITG